MTAKNVKNKVEKEKLVTSSPGFGTVVVTPIFKPNSEKRKSRAERCRRDREVLKSESGLTELESKKLKATACHAQLNQFRVKVPIAMHLTLALLQLLWGLTFGTIKPFLPIWLRYKGISTVEIGLVQTVGVCGQILSPLCGVVLDYLRHPALMTMVLCLTDAALGASIWLRPDSYVQYGEKSTSFSIYAFAFFGYGILQVIPGIFDTMILDWGSRERFGTYKMFCGIGWGISSALIGYFGEGERISIMFPAMVLCCLIIALIATILTFVKGRNPPAISSGSDAAIISELKVFFSSIDKKSWFVITNMLMGGASFAGIQLYLFLWLQDLGGSNFLMGLTMVITIAGEVPCFYIYVSVLKKIGPRRILGLGSAAYIVRMLWYTLLGVGKLQSPWFVFVVELLHGLTFAWMFGSCSVYAYLISPPQIRSTAVQFLNSVYLGAGGVLGSFVGGVIYQYGGGRSLFITLSVCMIPFSAYGLFAEADQMPEEFFGGKSAPPAGANYDEYTPLLETTPTLEMYTSSGEVVG